MSTGLSISRLITVSVQLLQEAAQANNVNTLLVLGDSLVIDVGQRIREYNTLQEAEADYPAGAPELAAFTLYFEQTPTPGTAYGGRWASHATPGILNGGVLTAAQQVLTNFTTITNGGIALNINGAAHNLTAMDFSAQTNLNGVASVMTTALGGVATCTWNGENFKLVTAAVGAGVDATGTITLTGNPSVNDIVDVNGTNVTFIATASVAAADQVNLGTTAAQTAANLLGFLSASTDANISQATYTLSGTAITVTDKTVGASGDAFTLAKTSTAITVSGSTLANGAPPATIAYATAGAGEDISTLVGFTAGTASPPVAGVNAESFLQAVTALDSLGTYWFALTEASPNVVDADRLAVANYIEATSHIYGFTQSNTQAISSTVTNDIGSQIMAESLEHTFGMYSTTTPYAAAAVFGMALTVDFTGTKTVKDWFYKVLAGVTPENLTPTQATALDNKRYNYVSNFDNGTAFLVNGCMCGPAYGDEIHGAISMKNDLVAALFNALYSTDTGVGQDDDGNHQLVNIAETIGVQYVTNGYLGRNGVYQGQGFGTLKNGDIMSKGYYAYCPPIATQSLAARAARKSMPIQMAGTLRGFINKPSIAVTVNR